VAVDLSTGPALAASRPRVLFAARYAAGLMSQPGYAVSRDGRLLLVETREPAEPDRLHVVLNWFDRLRELVPEEP